MPQDDVVRVLLVDDQPLFRTAISSLINAQDDFTVVGEAENGLIAVERAHELKPDLIVMDVEMPVMDGVEATRLLTEQMSHVRSISIGVWLTRGSRHEVRSEASCALCSLMKFSACPRAQ